MSAFDRLAYFFLGIFVFWSFPAFASLTWSAFPQSLRYVKGAVNSDANASIFGSVLEASEMYQIRRDESQKMSRALHVDFFATSGNGAKMIFVLAGAKVPRRDQGRLYRVKHGALIYHAEITGNPVALAFMGFNTHEIERIVQKIGLLSSFRPNGFSFEVARLIGEVFGERARADEMVRGQRTNLSVAEHTSDEGMVEKLAQSFSGCYILGGVTALNAVVVEPVRFVKDQILELPNRPARIIDNLSYAVKNPKRYWENSVDHAKTIWAQATDFSALAEGWNEYWKKPIAERNRILCGLVAPAVFGAYGAYARTSAALEKIVARRKMAATVSKLRGSPAEVEKAALDASLTPAISTGGAEMVQRIAVQDRTGRLAPLKAESATVQAAAKKNPTVGDATSLGARAIPAEFAQDSNIVLGLDDGNLLTPFVNKITAETGHKARAFWNFSYDARDPSGKILGTLVQVQENIKLAIRSRPGKKVIDVNLDGIDVPRIWQRGNGLIKENGEFTNSEIKFLLSRPEYFNATNWWLNGRRLNSSEARTLFAPHIEIGE
jgi:hypothetical protein